MTCESYLEHANPVTVAIIPINTVCVWRVGEGATKENLKLRTRQPVSLFSGFANNSAQKRSHCESVCLGESDCVWAAEGLERNLALDFTSDWPTFRTKKKIGSDIPFLYALWFLLKGIMIGAANIMAVFFVFVFHVTVIHQSTREIFQFVTVN